MRRLIDGRYSRCGDFISGSGYNYILLGFARENFTCSFGNQRKRNIANYTFIELYIWNITYNWSLLHIFIKKVIKLSNPQK